MWKKILQEIMEVIGALLTCSLVQIQRRFGVQHVDDHTLREDATEALTFNRIHRFYIHLRAQLLNAEVDQVGRAEILYDVEGKGGGHENG